MCNPNELPPRPQPADSNSLERSLRIYLADDLFQGDREIVIQHSDASYRLRITRADKLVLTK